MLAAVEEGISGIELDIAARTERLSQLLEERLDVRGKSFDAKLRRAGRLLPRHLRVKGQMLVDATSRAEHPRLLRQLDEAALDLAASDIERYLLSIDPWRRRKNIFLNWTASLSFNLLLVAGLVACFMWYLGS
ncbi:hypothetical protein SAMN04488030_1943 [Aliiroseovarius halocynthiae]|uniref:Uncharacterized protein n=1 Tax=Aliiroseovarius halocynthiae TaxID=985055 RepID=A0A545SR71_9RHOB|nr:hypothetical protein [Aliiroseovarius halocynthiae]TQV67468.1 hypothetical protein FIL88_09590 [Aliiroseovarius halocynthiae]SMR81476.1 hypothetical protein SAMN04488030_1943 [Aliiroseovarius halocynthiae]